MDQVSRPVQVLLAVTLLFAALWFVALRPKSSAGGESAAAPAPAVQTTPAPSSGTAPGTEGLTGAIDKAHDAVATANGDAERADRGSAEATTPAAGADTVRSATPARAVSRAEGSRRAGSAVVGRRPSSAAARTARAALRAHKAVAIAFVDSHTADARAVAGEIGHVSSFGGRAVTLAVPIARLSAFDFITNEVEVTVAPTVVIVDPRRRATTIVGFADRGEIEQRLADALAVKRRNG